MKSLINVLKPEQNGRRFRDEVRKLIFFNDCLNFEYNFTDIYSCEFNWWHQAITWTNVDQVPWRHSPHCPQTIETAQSSQTTHVTYVLLY